MSKSPFYKCGVSKSDESPLHQTESQDEKSKKTDPAAAEKKAKSAEINSAMKKVLPANK